MVSGGMLYRCAATPEKKSGSAGADVLGAALETLAEGLGGDLLRKQLRLLVEGAGSSSASSSLDTVGQIQTTLCQSKCEKNVYKQIEKKLICNTCLFEVCNKSNLQVTAQYMEH